MKCDTELLRRIPAHPIEHAGAHWRQVHHHKANQDQADQDDGQTNESCRESGHQYSGTLPTITQYLGGSVRRF
jgi:hypothetical protein